ncbi:hypothetical protein ABOZ73_15100 [Caulobacter sp. 73W]|uniref:1,4-beta-xylanase n=1 Tax=Caulobacter sp. 73W TaxID=3161137 RepID=A0AB39KQL6_9CAUL
MQNTSQPNRRPDQQQSNQQQSNAGQQNQQGQERAGQPGQGLSQGLDTGAIQPGKTSQGDDANR